MSRRDRTYAFIPAYACIPLLFEIVINALAYFGTKFVSLNSMYFDLSLPIDGRIPFVPVFSVFYLLSYAQWAVGYILVARENRELCYEALSGMIVSKLLCLLLFIIVPTSMARAEIASGSFFSAIVKCIYRFDAATNLFPSIHCLNSWFCVRTALQMKKTGKWYFYFSLVFTALVLASTVLIKQHVLVDIPAGILVCEIGQYVARKLHIPLFFERMNARLFL